MPRAELLETYFWLRDAPEESPRYNIAPTDTVLTAGGDRDEIVRWCSVGSRGGLFNLRAETALTKPGVAPVQRCPQSRPGASGPGIPAASAPAGAHASRLNIE